MKINPTRLNLYGLQDGCCFYCGRKCRFLVPPRGKRHPEDLFTIDHFFPKSRHPDMKWNAVGACYSCNQKKRNRPPARHRYEKFWHIQSLRKRIGKNVKKA